MTKEPQAEIAKGDEGIPVGWGNDVNQACTRWLRARGQLASQESPALAAAQASCAKRRRNLKRNSLPPSPR